jgi:hypothetical protein
MVVTISIILYTRNQATNLFQVMIGIFLTSNGVGTRPLNALHLMGLCVSPS